jgi:hypothetical protein
MNGPPILVGLTMHEQRSESVHPSTASLARGSGRTGRNVRAEHSVRKAIEARTSAPFVLSLSKHERPSRLCRASRSMNGRPVVLSLSKHTASPFVLSLSKHERPPRLCRASRSMNGPHCRSTLAVDAIGQWAVVESGRIPPGRLCHERVRTAAAERHCHRVGRTGAMAAGGLGLLGGSASSGGSRTRPPPPY